MRKIFNILIVIILIASILGTGIVVYIGTHTPTTETTTQGE